MNFKILPLIALSAVPALAQERWQIDLGIDHLREEKEVYSGATSMVLVHRHSGCLPSLQAGYRFKEFAASDLSVTAEYQFRKSFDVGWHLRGGPAQGASLDESGRMTRQSLNPGIQWNFHQRADFGFGLQGRFERLSSRVDAIDVSTTYFRPWLNLYVGHTFKTASKVKPYIGLRSSVALLTTESPKVLSDVSGSPGQRRLLRSMAGDSESSLQVGVRF